MGATPMRACPGGTAADEVARLADEANRAAAELRSLLACTPRRTDWYQVHRDMWIGYGDPSDLVAMTDHVTTAT
jgi:hypothetical protein